MQIRPKSGSSAENKITQRVAAQKKPPQSAIVLSDRFFEARKKILGSGLPFLYVDRNLGDQKILRSPLDRYFPTAFRGKSIGAAYIAEVESNRCHLSKNCPIFLEAKPFNGPILVGDISKLARLDPATDIFLDTVVHWPNIMAHGSQDDSIIYTAAIFQSGYFLPRQPEYARYLLTEVFPKYAQSSLSQVFADSLSLAILSSRHLPIVQALLDLGADPNKPSHEGVSPLNEALLRTNIEGVRLLLARGAAIKQDRALESPLDILEDHYDREEDKDLFEMIEKAAKRGGDAK